MSALPADVVPACSISEAMFRVTRWWRATRGGIHLGFARRSVLGKVIEEGCQGASHANDVRPMTYMDAADLQIDQIVARMPPELREAVVFDQDRSLNLKTMAAKMRATPNEVKHWVDNGYGFVAGALSAAGSQHRV